ncbi:MAG: TetR/AcrR family transcriptional regulator [Panacagrimonas sp.]
MKPRTPRKLATRLSSDDRSADILAAARAVVSEKGYENTLLSDIAKRAGVVDGTIYRYFENKRDLLIKVAEVWFGEQLTVDSHLDSIAGTQNKLRHLAWRTLDIIRREPVLARFMLMELRPDPTYKSTPFFEFNKKFTHEVLQLCRDAIKSGEFLDDVSPNMLRDLLHGCIEHRTWAFLRGEGDFDIDEVADSIAKVIYRGMRAERPAVRGDIDEAIRRLDEVAKRLEAKLNGD